MPGALSRCSPPGSVIPTEPGSSLHPGLMHDAERPGGSISRAAHAMDTLIPVRQRPSGPFAEYVDGLDGLLVLIFQIS